MYCYGSKTKVVPRPRSESKRLILQALEGGPKDKRELAELLGTSVDAIAKCLELMLKEGTIAHNGGGGGSGRPGQYRKYLLKGAA